MRRFITVLSLALAAVVAGRPAAAQEEQGRREHHAVWIGAMCIPVDEALRAQLQLEDGAGLLVAEIVPDSPADKAGLKRFDVVTGADGKPLKHIVDLMKAVEAAGDKELKLDVYRHGKKQSLDVKPVERPRGDVLRRFNLPLEEGRGPGPGLAQSPEQLREWVEKMRKNLPEEEAKRMQEWVEQMQRGEAQPFRMKMFGPGVVMHQAPAVPLPKGVKVLVKKSADGPTEIHVERGDEKWDITDKELDKLPADLREPIGAMIRGGGFGTMIVTPEGAAAAQAFSDSGPADVKIEIDGKTVPIPGARPFMIPLPPQAPGAPSAKEFEALKKQVEELQKRLDELNKTDAPAKTPAKKAAKEKA